MLEFGTPTEDYTTSQSETRQATGEKLIDMLVMHGLLQEQYALNFQNLPTVLNRYEAGVNDCHTYVDKILISVGEPVSTIKRFTQDDRVLGQVVGAALSFFSPSNKKPQDSSHRIAAEPSEPTDKNGHFKQ